jgi:DNA-binding MarR family transcriptional regulator
MVRHVVERAKQTVVLRAVDDERPDATIRASLNRKALASARHRAALGRLLGLAEHDVLAAQHLARAGSLTPTQLGALLELTSGGVTTLVQRLERHGHVTRSPHPTDRRSTLLRLTAEFEQTAGELFAPLVDDIERAVEALSERDRAVVARFLAEVAHAGEARADELARAADAQALATLSPPSPALWA